MLLRKGHNLRPVLRRYPVTQTPLPDGAIAFVDATTHDSRTTERVDNLRKAFHGVETLQNVLGNVNTNCHARQGTIQSVTDQAERLLALQRAARFSTLAEFARTAGVEPGTARQQANRSSIPQAAAAKYISAARSTGATVEWLLYGTGQGPRPSPDAPPEPPAAEPSPDPALPIARMTNEPFPTGTPDVPVWASAQAGDDGAIVLTPDPIDYIHRSERMRGVKNPFAFYVVGDSMSPVIEHGDQVVVNPTIPVRPGVDCVFIHQQADGTFLALVKRLLRQNLDVMRVRQYNSPRDYELSRKKWTRAHVISEIRRGGL